MARALGLGFFGISLGYNTARRKKPHGQRREQQRGFSTAGGMRGGEPGYAPVPRSQAPQRLRGGRGEEEWDTEAQHPSVAAGQALLLLRVPACGSPSEDRRGSGCVGPPQVAPGFKHPVW